MKKTFGLLSLILVVCLAVPVMASEPVKVDVLFMNHGPLQKTINDMRAVFDRYDGKIAVNWHEFFSQEGKAFMQSKGVDRHVPLVIWINDKDTQPIDGVDVRFSGFPTGSGPAMFQGAWDMDKLDAALKQTTK